MHAPARLLAVPDLALPGHAIDLAGALRLDYLPLALVILFFALFDTLGTLMGLAHQAGLLRGGTGWPPASWSTPWSSSPPAAAARCTG